MNRSDDLHPDGDAGNPGRTSRIAGVVLSPLHGHAVITNAQSLHLVALLAAHW